MKRREKRSTRLLLEELEPRILHSADLAVLVPPAALVQAAEIRLLDDAPAASSAASRAPEAEAAAWLAPREIAIVDSAVPDYHDLIDDIRANSSGRVDVFTLDAATDGLDQISQILASQHDIAAIHIISHGSDGAIRLGSGVLDSETLKRNAAAVGAWGAALSADADILLYGCDVAFDAAGRSFVDALSALTGADVAASADRTGSSVLGGNWALEYSAGAIETSAAPSAQAQAQWAGTLGIAPVLALPGAAPSYTENDPASIIDATATVTDADSVTFDTGTLTVGFSANGTADDRLAIRNQGTGAGEIGVSGVDVTYGGVIIGSYAGGSGTTALVVTFNADSSPAAAEALLRNVTFENVSDAPSTLARTVRFVLVDETGDASAAATQTINVAAVNDAPTASNLDAAQSYTEDTPLDLTDIVIGDVDSASVTATLTLSNAAAGSLGTATSGAVTSTYNSGTGTWTASGATSDVNTLLAGLTFTPAADFAGSFTIATSVSDGAAAPVTGTKAMTATAVNDAPVRTAGTPAPINVNEDSANVTAVTLGLGGLTYGPGGGADESVQSLTYKVTAIPAHITVWLADGTTQVAADTTITLAQLQGLKYKTVGDAGGSGNLTWTVQDNGATAGGGADTLTENLAITVNAVNDAPVLSGTQDLAGINQNATTNGGTRVSDLIAGRVADADAAALSGIAVTSVNNTNGTWEYSRNAGGNWTSFATPSGSSAMLLAADASTYVRFVPAANWVGTVTPGLTFRAWDQTSGAAGTSADTTANGGATAFSTALQSASVTVHAYPIVFSGSYLEDFSSLGTSGTRMTAGFRAMVIAGSGATYDAANPITADAIASATASNQTLLVWNPGDPAAQSQSQLFNGGTIGDAANRVLMSGAHVNAATVVELAMRNTTGSALATISFGYDMKVLADGAAPQTEAGELPGYTFFYSLTGGTTAAEWIAVPSLATTMSTVGDVQSVNTTLTFATPLANNATMYFRWADDNFPQLDADYGIDNVSVQRVNNAPELSGIESGAIAYVENAAATPVTSTLTVADVDNVNLTGATVTIAANYASGQDVLAFTNQNGISGSWSAASGVLSLSGTATLANYQAALRSVTYANTSDTPSTLTRTLSFVVTDGIDGSVALTRDIAVTSVNDAPVLAGTNDMAGINRNPTTNPGTLVADLLAGHVTDADTGALQGIAVTAADNTSGAWQYSTDGGSNWTAFGTPATTSARLLAADVATFVRFVPNANFSGTVANGLTFHAWDQSSGAAGGTIDTTASGGSTAFSAATASASIVVSAANTAPTLTGSNNLAAVNEDAAANGGTLVSALIAGFTSDADPGALTGIAVTAVDNANGAWQYSLDSGGSWSAFGAPAAASARLLAADASTYVRFVPNADWNGTVNGGITFRAWDRSTGVAGATADTSGVAGTFRDNFQTASYANNDGTLAWTGSWVETDSLGGGAASGRFEIMSGVLVIQAGNVGDNIYREADLSGATGATLSFAYGSNLKGNASLLVQVSSDGGANYTTLAGGVFNASNNTYAGSRSYDITSSIASNTRVRWIVAGTESASDSNLFYVDNIQITASARNGSGTAFSTATAASAVTVNPVNDAPVRTAGSVSNLTVLEDAAATSLGLGALAYAPGGGGDEAAQTLTYTVTTLPSAALGAVTLSDGTTAVTASTSYTLGQLQGMKFKAAANAAGGPSTFSWTVADSGGTANGGVDTLTQSVTVTVTAVNDAPSGADKTVTTAEDTAYTFSAADFGFSDSTDTPANALSGVRIGSVPGAGSLALSGVAVSAGQFVAVGAINAGNLRFTPAANANGAAYASFTFQVQDDGGVANGGVDTDPTARTMTVNVTSVNDAPSGASHTVTTLEDTAYTFSAADFGFTDTDSNALLNVKIGALPVAGSLTLSGAAVTAGQFVSAASIAAGNLEFMPAAHANGAAYASFTFQVQDDGGVANGGIDMDATARTMTIDVTSVNDAPAGADRTVATLEDTRYTFTAADFGFTDPNDSNALLAVRISSVPAAGGLTLAGAAVTSGQLVSASSIAAGDLQFVPAANASGAAYASFTFQVRDDGGTGSGGVDLDPTPKTMTIDVTAVNDAPVASDRSVTMLEDGAYTFSAADFGFADPADAAGAGANALSAVRISTLPVAGTLACDFVPVTAGQLISLADLDAGKLIFIPAANANGANYASFTFQVKDDGGVANGGADLDAIARTLRVNVTSVNDAPAGADNTVTTREDVAYTFSAADFGYADAHDSNALLGVKVASLPAAGTLTLAGVAIANGQSVSAAALAAGDFKFTPALDQSGAAYASFTFQVQDDGGIANGGADTDATARTLTVNVTSVNDAPAGASNAVTTLEDTAYVFRTADFGFSDIVDSDALLNVKIGALPLAGTLTLDGIAVTSGQSVSAAAIAAGALRFNPAADANGAGYASFTFQVQDDGGVANGGVDLAPVASTMTVNITPVNDAPAGADASVATLEDTAYVFRAADFGFSDRDGNALLAVKIGSLPVAGSLTLGGVAVSAGQVVSASSLAAGDLEFSPAANASGAAYASFTFQVQDDGGTANAGADSDPLARSMIVNVTSVNDAPAGLDATVSTREDIAYTLSAADFGYTDAADPAPNALLAVKVGAMSGGGTFTLAGAPLTVGQLIPAARIGAGELQFTPARSGTGAGYATITFQVRDDGGTANGGIDTGAPRTLTVDVIRTRFPVDAALPVFVAEPAAPQQPSPAAAAEETTESATDTRARATLAKIAASLSEALAQTRIIAGNDVEAQVTELAPALQREADAAVLRSPTSSLSARAEGNRMVVAAPDLTFEAKPEAARLVLVPTVGGGARAAAAAAAEESSTDTEAKEQAHAVLTLENGVRASAIIVSAGLVSWTLQGAGLIASLLTSAPAWRHLDPLPVLAPEEEKPDWGENDRDAQREEAAADSLWRIT